MSAIPPPPVTMVTTDDLATKLDNDHALTALRGAGLPPFGEPLRRAEPLRAEPLRAEPPRAEPPRAEPPRARRGSWLGSLVGLAAFGAASAVAALAGGLVTARPRTKRWYRGLRKSSLTPPDRVFGLVWPVLYSLGALSAWRVARAPESKVRRRALGLWGTQLAFNAAWTPLFFGARRPRLAMADLVANQAALGAYAVAARKVDKTAAWMVVPYLGWLTFAGALNAAIVRKNRGLIRGLLARARGRRVRVAWRRSDFARA